MVLAISVDPLLGASLSPEAAGIGPFLHSLLLAGPGPAHDYGAGGVREGWGGAGAGQAITNKH